MPFTISHVAAVLPGYRFLTRWRVFSAAVIGSMVPDFGLLVPWITRREQTHGLAALLTFCLPMGLLAWWLTQKLIRPAIIEVLPERAYARLASAHPPARLSDARAWLLAAIFIVAGAVTHLIWDDFTHEGARGVRMFPVLGAYAPDVEGHAVHLFRWLQYGSSVVGLAVVIAALIVWLRHAPPLTERLPRRLSAPERANWIALYVGIPLAAVIVATFIPLFARQPPLHTGWILEDIAIAGMRALAGSLIFTSLLLRSRLETLR